MQIGKQITLFLIDGSVDGVIAMELSNWTGKAFKIPRNHLKAVADREELRKAGIYFLFGKDDSDAEIVYIGEAEEIYKRLQQHQEKDFWSEALAFISKDENLNKAHIKYLEYTLHGVAKDAGRFKLFNTNTPNCPSISEAEQAVMMEFSSNLQLLVGTAGYRLFEKLASTRSNKNEQYFINAARGADAAALFTAEGMVVLKGSKCANSEVPSIPEAVAGKRKALIKSGILKDWGLVEDFLFSSPSIAAAVVMGRSANGLIEWRKKDGTNLKENQTAG
jgi:hypothetical protein